MQIHENISLKPYNTFSIDVASRYFSTFESVAELSEVHNFVKQSAAGPLLILGGGSNILFTKNYDGLVAKNQMRGIEVVEEDDEHYYVKAAAGENWHGFVMHCIQHNYAGLENLSLIPGNVGASPMQNIGAYGVEIKDVFHELSAYDLEERKLLCFSAAECEFGYRESIFKRRYKNRFVITDVTFRLRKQPFFRVEYGAIQQELETMKVKDLSIAFISQAVINIRQSKLPDPKEIGNAGSFFKNPTIDKEKFEVLRGVYPNIVGHAVDARQVKVAAGWMIEQCGWKGYRDGDAGCHVRQALVLVNYGTAAGSEVYALSQKIIDSVEYQFGIALEREVNIF